MEHMQQRARQLFEHPLADVSTVEHNVAAWQKAVEYLGDKWLLAKPVARLSSKRRKK